MLTRSRAWLAAIFGPNGLQRDELFLLVGVLLLARGLWLAWAPAGYIAPGAIVLWIALPTRARFIVPRPGVEPKPKPRELH